MKRLHPSVTTALAAVLLAATPAWAGDGHDHGPAAPTAAGPAQPRFAAVSDLFELVGVLNGKQITLYLDRSADNSPVSEAQIELDVGGKQFKATKQGADEFEVVLAEVPGPGVLPITAQVSAGKDTDLLAGELDIHAVAQAPAHAHATGWKAYAAWATGGLALLAALAFAVRRVFASRQAPVGSAA
jgi:hypothetical protein